MEPARLTSNDLLDAVRSRYAPPEWHCEAEVTLGGRRLDVLALNMWGARRYCVVGFEIKVSRGDWMRELAAFHKAEEWVRVCDAFYVVTPPKLVRSDELPDGWGHLELCGSRMFTRRIAARQNPVPTTLPREVAARFITRLVQEREQFRRQTENDLQMEITERARNRAREEITREQTNADAALLRKAELYDKLVTALGLGTDWRPEDRALRAAKLLAKFNVDRLLLDRIAHLLESVQENLTTLHETVKVLDDCDLPRAALPAVEPQGEK